ncbi:solute carrier family 43 member 3-like [Haliotis rubra]|uniref:solute carrier family 43 member 3-like n=1 Tax=Haliotis rubra TaxID=36100 RepID=UPI001EE5CF97|nr:solute carrier family 43 member 3-like [Haliotis rubra]
MFAGISKDTPWMMFIGYLALANGGLGILQTNNQVSYMFEKGGPTVIGLICGAFDASGAVMLGVKLAYDNGVSLQMSFIVIGCLNIMAVISTFTFLPKKFIKNTQPNSNTDADQEAVSSEGANHSSLNIKNESSEKTMLLRGQSRNLTLHGLRSEASDTPPGIDTYPTAEEGNHVATKGDVSGMKEDKEISKNSLLLGYIFSPLYMLTVVWGCVIQLIFVLFIGSFNAWLEHITHHVQERVSVLTDFLFTVMLASPVVSILSGAMVDFFYSIQPEMRSHKTRTHYALAAPIALTNFLALILCACVVVEREDMTYVTVITSVLYRTLLYSGLTLFSRLMYPSEYFAAIYGVLFTISGLVNFLQYPLFLWCQSSPSGYRQVYGMLGLASILISVQPIYLIYTGYREKQ